MTSSPVFTENVLWHHKSFFQVWPTWIWDTWNTALQYGSYRKVPRTNARAWWRPSWLVQKSMEMFFAPVVHQIDQECRSSIFSEGMMTSECDWCPGQPLQVSSTSHFQSFINVHQGWFQTIRSPNDDMSVTWNVPTPSGIFLGHSVSSDSSDANQDMIWAQQMIPSREGTVTTPLQRSTRLKRPTPGCHIFDHENRRE